MKIPTTELPEITENDFACHCNDEGKAEIAAVRAWVYENLSTDKHTVDASNLVSAVVYNLEHGYSAAITGIGCDMWAGISAKTHDNKFVVFIQCDDIEDGFAYVYAAFVREFGDGYDYDIEVAKAERAAGR